jgi:acetyl esterase/lipase
MYRSSCFKKPAAVFAGTFFLLSMVAHALVAQEEDTSGGERIEPTFADVKYGHHERNVLDVWLPNGKRPDTPAPLVIYIHGGGFTAGDKRVAGNQAQLVRECSRLGWVYASINYRYAKDGVKVVDSMTDGRG